jgi:hypothetical protein
VRRKEGLSAADQKRERYGLSQRVVSDVIDQVTATHVVGVSSVSIDEWKMLSLRMAVSAICNGGRLAEPVAWQWYVLRAEAALYALRSVHLRSVSLRRARAQAMLPTEVVAKPTMIGMTPARPIPAR